MILRAVPVVSKKNFIVKMEVEANSTSLPIATPDSVFSPSPGAKSLSPSTPYFTYENGSGDADGRMSREELKKVEANVYERYIRDLKGILISRWSPKGNAQSNVTCTIFIMF